MLDKRAPSAEEQAKAWIPAFNQTLAAEDEADLRQLFEVEDYWRNLFGPSWQFATFNGRNTVRHALHDCATEVQVTEFVVDSATLAPRISVAADRKVIEARSKRTTPALHARDFSEPGWIEQRQAAQWVFENRETDVLVLGGVGAHRPPRTGDR